MWRCDGSIYGPDGAASPSEVTLDVRLDLDERWLLTEFRVSSGRHEYEFNAYRTHDAASSRWVNVIVDNMGGYAVSSSRDAVTWTGEATGPMGTMHIRDTEASSAPGELALRGQYSLDGHAWSTGYELSCKRQATGRADASGAHLEHETQAEDTFARCLREGMRRTHVRCADWRAEFEPDSPNAEAG